ncbi:DUF5937 family protein [Humidisolicoccus flavus]|uniref:DUF5937 family protein n=1 Tax=Humidisolicoccus flavus TaxID=3111414 RepID=UPI003250A812
MPIVFDVANVSPQNVAVSPRVLSELMALLHVHAESGHHRDRIRELRRISDLVPGSLAGQLRLYAPLWARFRFRALMPLSTTIEGGADSFEAELHEYLSLPEDVFVAMAAEGIAGVRLPKEKSPEFDEAAFVEFCRTRSEEREDLAVRLLRDPILFQQNVGKTLVQAYSAFFGQIWASSHELLTSDAARMQSLIQPGSIAEVLASLAHDSHLFGKRQQVVFDKIQSAVVSGDGRKFVLVPSMWTSPHVVVKYDESYADQSVPVVVQYLAGESGRDAPSLGIVTNRMLVLADGPRLQLSRHLVNESCTTSELAQRTGMTTPQVSRHLRRLKDVGLIVSQRDGRMIKHRLRSDLVYQLGHEYLNALTR